MRIHFDKLLLLALISLSFFLSSCGSSSKLSKKVQDAIHAPIENGIVEQAMEEFTTPSAKKSPKKKSSSAKEEMLEKEIVGKGKSVSLDDDTTAGNVVYKDGKYVIEKKKPSPTHTKKPTLRAQKDDTHSDMDNKSHYPSSPPSTTLQNPTAEPLFKQYRQSDIRASDPVKKSLTYKKRAAVSDLKSGHSVEVDRRLDYEYDELEEDIEDEEF